MGCGVWGVGCGVWGVGCGVWGVGCGVWGVGDKKAMQRGLGGFPHSLLHQDNILNLSLLIIIVLMELPWFPPLALWYLTIFTPLVLWILTIKELTRPFVINLPL
uniref:Uncharacterized protein n=1 Tax=Moorena producens (strain JHB) TaxID=1454205 RepID=A0A1D9G7H9_MOOP1